MAKQSNTKTDDGSKVTTDHNEIRKWVEARQGRPATVKGTEGRDDAGVLRINFPGGSEDSLQDLSWEDFFTKFEEAQLAFLYQDQLASGETSRFFKFVRRE